MPTDKRIRQRENREKQLAARAKVERNQKLIRRSRFLIVIAAVAGIFWWLTTRDTTETSATSVTAAPIEVPSDYEGFRAQATACGADQPTARSEVSFTEPEDQGLTGVVDLTLSTSCGDLALALDTAGAPESVNSFVFLANQGYFDGIACHRLVPGFVLQCGDPTASGSGGPGYVLPDEFPEEGFAYNTGVVAMANAGPGTTGSQFFLVIGETGLDNNFTVLGTFTDPGGVVDGLLATPLGTGRSGERSTPLESIYLNSVTVEG